jgi:NAD(P)-dependent dehydrogenase (short-subunit alcohol dehydrogenase family)
MPSHAGFTAAAVPDQSGKCFVVTGANTGIGFEASRVLAARGARVLLACRDESKAATAMAQIRQDTPHADLAFLPLNLTDLASVRHAADRASQEQRIDVLINNAGVMTPKLTHTSQGFELQFGVNHLGCFALTALLLPKLLKASESRIVVTGSGSHRSAKIDWDDLNAEKSYNGMGRYAASKLANMLFLSELNRRLQAAGSSTMAIGCHPGVAGTEMGRNTAIASVVMPLVRLFLNTPAMGAWGTLQAATGQVKPGAYYGPTALGELRGPSHECPPSAQAQDPQLAARLWNLSITMTGIDPGLPSAQ